MNYTFPQHLFYDRKNHMWACPESGAIVRIGIDPLGLSSLGELAYLSLNPPTSEVLRGQSMGVLEAAKMTGDVIAPVSGKMSACNQAALEDPFLVNQDPYENGWLALLETETWAEDSMELVSGSEIAVWAAGEIERYRKQGWID